MASSVFYVGTPEQVGHHAAPIASQLDVKIVPPELIANQANAGDVAIFFSEHFQPARDAIVELRKKSVATLYAIDGILEWRNAWDNLPNEPACPWTMRPGLCDKVAVIGPSQYRILSGWGNAEKLELVGIPRLDRWIADRDSNRASLQYWSEERPIRMMVATAKTAGFTPDQVATTKASLEAVKDFVLRENESPRRSWDVTWRLTGELAAELDVASSTESFSGLDLRTQLESVDIVVTTPSTLMIEAMLLGKIVVLLDWHSVPQWVPAAWQIRHLQEVELILGRLAGEQAEDFTDTNSAELAALADAERRLIWQEQILADALRMGPDASDRFVRLVRQVQAEADACLRESKPLQFAPVLDVEPSQLGGVSNVTIDHASTYPSYPEFLETDLRILQAGWAQARRHADDLQSRLSQVQSELDLAHEIFDSIEKHPIAGPIVRGRQRMIDWWNRKRASSNSKERAESSV